MPHDQNSVVRSTPGLTLLGGLVAVIALLYGSLLALSDPWLGVAVGALLLAVAWRTRPPYDARVLRWITAGFGAFLVAYDVLVLLVR